MLKTSKWSIGLEGNRAASVFFLDPLSNEHLIKRFSVPPFYSIQQIKPLWKYLVFLYQNSASLRESFVYSFQMGQDDKAAHWGFNDHFWIGLLYNLLYKLGVMLIHDERQLCVPTIRGWILPLKTYRTWSLLGSSPENFCPASWKSHLSMSLFSLDIFKHPVKK